MNYNPLESVVNYFKSLYQGVRGALGDITQKVNISLIPSSGLEFAVAGVPNSVLNRQPETQDNLQGYFFEDYGVRSYGRIGRNVVVTRSDGTKIHLDNPRNSNGIDERYVKNVLMNHGIGANNKIAGKIAKLLRQKS